MSSITPAAPRKPIDNSLDANTNATYKQVNKDTIKKTGKTISENNTLLDDLVSNTSNKNSTNFSVIVGSGSGSPSDQDLNNFSKNFNEFSDSLFVLTPQSKFVSGGNTSGVNGNAAPAQGAAPTADAQALSLSGDSSNKVFAIILALLSELSELFTQSGTKTNEIATMLTTTKLMIASSQLQSMLDQTHATFQLRMDAANQMIGMAWLTLGEGILDVSSTIFDGLAASKDTQIKGENGENLYNERGHIEMERTPVDMRFATASAASKLGSKGLKALSQGIFEKNQMIDNAQASQQEQILNQISKKLDYIEGLINSLENAIRQNSQESLGKLQSILDAIKTALANALLR